MIYQCWHCVYVNPTTPKCLLSVVYDLSVVSVIMSLDQSVSYSHTTVYHYWGLLLLFICRLNLLQQRQRLQITSWCPPQQDASTSQRGARTLLGLAVNVSRKGYIFWIHIPYRHCLMLIRSFRDTQLVCFYIHHKLKFCTKKIRSCRCVHFYKT